MVEQPEKLMVQGQLAETGIAAGGRALPRCNDPSAVAAYTRLVPILRNALPCRATTVQGTHLYLAQSHVPGTADATIPIRAQCRLPPIPMHLASLLIPCAVTGLACMFPSPPCPAVPFPITLESSCFRFRLLFSLLRALLFPILPSASFLLSPT
jgi:hypothetical protein